MSHPDYDLHDSVDRPTTQASGSATDRARTEDVLHFGAARSPASRHFSDDTSGLPGWPAV